MFKQNFKITVMKRAIFFVLVISVCNTAMTQNMVVNPGFENWETSTKPAGWTIAQNCTRESSVNLSGSFCCSQTGTATDSKDLSQKIPVIPGKTYSISINYMTSPVSAGNGGRLWCRWVDADGAFFDEDASKVLMQSGYLKSATWNSLLITIIAPPAAASINLLIRTLPNSATYWDDISFVEGTPTLADDFIFENIKIYPIPAGDFLHLENIRGINKIELLNITGSVLKLFSTSGQRWYTIQTVDLSEGIYFLRMTDVKGRIIVKKFIR